MKELKKLFQYMVIMVNRKIHYHCQSLLILVLFNTLAPFIFENLLTAQSNNKTDQNIGNIIPGGNNFYYTHSPPTKQIMQKPEVNYPMRATAQDIIEQSYKITEQQMGAYIDRPYLSYQQNQKARQDYQIANAVAIMNNGPKNQNQEILKILNEANASESGKRLPFDYYKTAKFINKTKAYTDAFNLLKDMANGTIPISLKDAFYIIENAYGNMYLSYDDYCSIIEENAEFIKQMMSQSGLSAGNNEALHKSIQEFMRDTTTIKLPQNEMIRFSSRQHLPYTYDYIDFKGEMDFRNYFVSKALATGTGQCNSLPMVYAIHAEALKAKFYISTAPNHSFIKFPDNTGTIHNYEPTSHWIISDDWYCEHLFILPKAERSGIYLDTLNYQMIIGDCIASLGFSYLMKYGVTDGNFINDCINASLQCFPKKNGLQAILLRSSLLAHMLDRLLFMNEIRDLSEIDRIEGAKELYEALKQNELLLKSLGYTETPAGIYEQQMNLQEFRAMEQANKGFSGKEKRNLFINLSY